VSIFSETRLRQAQPERFDIHIERIFPLTLSSSKGIFAFFDSLVRRGDKRWALARRTTEPALVGSRLIVSGGLRHSIGDRLQCRISFGSTFSIPLTMIRRALELPYVVIVGALITTVLGVLSYARLPDRIRDRNRKGAILDYECDYDYDYAGGARK
jgi:hypothetical protein